MESTNLSISLDKYTTSNPNSHHSEPRLQDFFAQESHPRKYSDDDFQQISRLLQANGSDTWSKVPRIYTVLRCISNLELLDTFIDQGLTDIWFPFTANQLPRGVSATVQRLFLDSQHLASTKALELEGKLKKHAHFGPGEAVPLEVGKQLGAGAYGNVEIVVSSVSKKEYARKLFRRTRGQKNSESIIASFKTEVQILKRIDHLHCIEMVGSYTDQKYFGLIMAPVADCNLITYFEIANSEDNLDILRSFYGCLAGAVSYLHERKIRHRDIKPSNILVKSARVFLTDFGISLDWETLSGSTTTADSAKTWLYCAPEVALFEPRNRSADIYSLGCVFLEMATILKRFTIENLRAFFFNRSRSHRFYENSLAIEEWVTYLENHGNADDNLPLQWSKSMLQATSEHRPSAPQIFDEIASLRSKSLLVSFSFCGECCERELDSSDSNDDNDSEGRLWADAEDSIENSSRQEGPLQIGHNEVIQKILDGDTTTAWTPAEDAEHDFRVNLVPSNPFNVAPEQISLPSNIQDYGLKCVYEGTKSTTIVDIIAIHGLNSSTKTWKSEGSHISWLSNNNLLPKSLPNARVLTWAYNPDFSDPELNDFERRVIQLAETLVAEIEADRALENASTRPIIFLCHSFGGIIVKKALLYSASKTSKKLSHLRSVFVSCHAILFFGTPHSEECEVPSIFTDAVIGNHPLLTVLRNHSLILQVINVEFAPYFAEFNTSFFWEQEPTTFGNKREYIVRESSAAPMLPDTERSGIPKTHDSLCKFDARQAPGYATVISLLMRSIRDAPDVIERRWKFEEEKRRVSRLQEARELMMA